MSISHRLIELGEERVTAMRRIVIEHPRMTEAHTKFETLMAQARHNPDGEKSCFPLIAPSASGKTTIVKRFVEKKNTKEALSDGRIPALHVTLKAPATRKSFAQDILIALGEFGFETAPDVGSENFLQERVRVCLREAKVELLFIDEFHHLVMSKNVRVVHTVGETVKWMLIKGVCPIVVSGTEDALNPFRANPQLVRRALPGINLAALSVYREADKQLFITFLANFLHAMEKAGVAENAKSLLNGDVPACLLEISGGVLGLVCKLLEDAVRLMTYAERNAFIRDDLGQAADAFLLDKKSDSNPFADGPKPLRASAAA
jgi:hypothetical protein